MLSVEDRLTQHDVWAWPASDNIPQLAERIHGMLEGAVVVRTFRYLEGESRLDVLTGLRLDEYRFRGDSAWWNFKPGLGNGFGIAAHSRWVEEGAANRAWNDGVRRNISMLTIEGRSTVRAWRIEKRDWNEHGVGMETVIVPQALPAD